MRVFAPGVKKIYSVLPFRSQEAARFTVTVIDSLPRLGVPPHARIAFRARASGVPRDTPQQTRMSTAARATRPHARGNAGANVSYWRTRHAAPPRLLENREVVKLVEFPLARDTPKGRRSDRVGADFERTQRGDGLGGEAYPAIDRARHHSRGDVETETMQVVAGDEE